MPTTITKTVKTSGGDYTSLSAWEAGEQADLPTLDQISVAECYAMDDTAAVTLDGWTTDATRYIRIYAPSSERHPGKWDTGKYRKTNAAGPLVTILENYVRMEGLQLHRTGNPSVDDGIVWIGADNATDIRILGCVIRGNNNASGNYSSGVQWKFQGIPTKVIVANCIIYDIGPGGFKCSGIWNQSDVVNSLYAYNNTFQNLNDGIGLNSANTAIAKNNLFSSCTTACTGTFAAGTDYNATNNASMNYTVTGAGNTHDRLSQTFQFANEAGDDFHLLSSDTGAKDGGVDLSGDADYAFSDDVDGQARTGTWDIGADEYVVAGPVMTLWAQSML
jgi:hypothetical protein